MSEQWRACDREQKEGGRKGGTEGRREGGEERGREGGMERMAV